MVVLCLFFFSSRRRHTRCALVTGVQTCALPISVRYANQLPPQIESLVVDLKRNKPHWGARKIRELLVQRLAGDVRVPAKSTLHTVLHRHGLDRKSDVSGKTAHVRVDLGGRRSNKIKKNVATTSAAPTYPFTQT